MAEQISILEQAISLQNRASSPRSSVWVSASAGSGKTKVLTDRLLRILLDGVDPQKVMCLTFTKAAAAEMQNRLNDRLSSWVAMDADDLKSELEKLQVNPSSEIIKSARELFYGVLESPGGIKIQTIHGFCQSILKRFPLESGVSPHFEVADDFTASEILTRAWHAIYANTESRLILQTIADAFGESRFSDLNRSIISEYARVKTIPDDFASRLYQEIGIDGNWSGGAAIKNLPIHPGVIEEKNFKGVSDKALLNAAIKWEKSEKGLDDFNDYKLAFLTQSGEVRKKLLTKAALEAEPEFAAWAESSAEYILRIEQQIKAKRIYDLSRNLMAYMRLLFAEYESIKARENLLDYNDLVAKVADLLGKSSASQWVLYKLDGGIDHILVDEAQDTNSTQWQVIKAIGDEFFNAQDGRTLFVVGDEKQSIYSFQGADPAIFGHVKESFKNASLLVQKPFEEIGLRVSFRSSNAVLQVVDQTFKDDKIRKGVSDGEIKHLAFRESSPGRVELWPLIIDAPKEDITPWSMPESASTVISSKTRLAQHMALTIKYWLDSGRVVQSRKVTPGDILILLRKRGDFVFELSNALKANGIPVAGVDRIVLLDQLVVQDLLAFMQFVLCPEDDLTLAVILKGPLFNWDDDQLFAISHARGDLTLWEQLNVLAQSSQEVSILADLLETGKSLSPHKFLNKILVQYDGYKRFRARLGDQILDAVQELLTLSLNFAQTNPPSLQVFLNWIESGASELKRDMDQSNEVRIMTVHGSKGLQSPIVFMPDTTQIPSDIPDFVWHKGMAIHMPPESGDVAMTKLLKTECKSKQLEEYNRLLYVAMTRAEDELYVAGWSKSENINENCWYQSVRTAMAGMVEPKSFAGDHWHGEGFALVDDREVSIEALPMESIKKHHDIPEFMHLRLRPEPVPAMPLSPSRIESGEAPKFKGAKGGMNRGRIIHKLLEILPEIAPEKWEVSCEHYLRHQNISDIDLSSIKDTIIKIINENSQVFGENSLSEVPVVGSIGPINISGKIDRIVIDGSRVVILDYKTNRDVPKDISEIPRSYILQMALYQALIQEIYPNYQIVCQLLWTAELKLDTIPELVLKNALHNFVEQRKAA